MRPRSSLGNCHLLVELKRFIVVNVGVSPSVFGKHPTVTMVSELIQAGIRHDKDIVAEFLPKLRDCCIQDSSFIPCLGATSVFIGVNGYTEQIYTPNTSINRLFHNGFQGMYRMLILTWH